MLLQWCTLEPSGDGNLAAIRFSSPVRLRSIRIFPKDARPFAQREDVVRCVEDMSGLSSGNLHFTLSETEPQAFLLHLYFSAYRVARVDSREKPKPTNALTPTTLAYAGGEMEFAVPMGNEVCHSRSFYCSCTLAKGAYADVRGIYTMKTSAEVTCRTVTLVIP